MASSRLSARLFTCLTILIFLAFGLGCLAAEFELATDHLTDRPLADALTAGFSLEQRVGAGLLDPHSAEVTAAVSAEQAKLSAVLRAFGYLDGNVAVDPTMAAPPLRLRPVPGRVFRIGAIAVALSEPGGDEIEGDLLAIAQSSIGSRASGDVLGAMERRLVRRVQDAGYPHPQVVVRNLVPDLEEDLATVSLTIETGEAARFGRVSLSHGRVFTLAALQAILPFQPGDPYAPAKVDELRAALAVVPNIRAARVSVGDGVDADGGVPITVQVREVVAEQLLTAGRSAGQLALGLVLGLLALRQITVAAGLGTRGLLVRGETALVILALAWAGWLVAQRIVSFAGLG